MSIPCQFEFSGSHLYESVIHFVSLVFRTAPISIGHCLVRLCLDFWGHTYIDWSFPCQFSFWSRIYIDRPSSYQFVFSSIWDRTYTNRSFILSIQFSAPHLYWSIIHLVSSVFEITPILIDHFLVSSILGTALISISHCLVSWVDFYSSSSRVCLVEFCSILSHISFFGFILSEDRSFLILLIIESFIVSWSSVIHCIYTLRIIRIFG